jgi:hypothetical protein
MEQQKKQRGGHRPGAGRPAVDFTPFIEGQDSFGINHRSYIEGAQGKDPLNANISSLDYYELI